MKIPSFTDRVKKIESEKFEGPVDLCLQEFAVKRCLFRIHKLSRLLELARQSKHLRVANKREKLWAQRLEIVKKSLERFEKLKKDAHSALVFLQDLELHPVVQTTCAPLEHWVCLV